MMDFTLENEECFFCGDSVNVETTAPDGYCHDSDDVTCMGCGEKGFVIADEETFSIHWYNN